MSCYDIAITVRNLTNAYRSFGYPCKRSKQFLVMKQEKRAKRGLSPNIPKKTVIRCMLLWLPPPTP
jgi:hypothetical protein